MAGSSLLALLDDITSLLDDVALLTKVAAKKTGGVLGDDLALNAQQVTGVEPDRELPVVWAVAKGSARNKVILVPLALAIGTFAPWGVTPLLMIGGAFLCFEGFEKLAHRFLHSEHEVQSEKADMLTAAARSATDLLSFEQDKIKGAVRTDFILSAEIVAIALGTVAHAPFATKLAALVAVAVAMTVGVYGFVAGIVKLDDLALHLSRKTGTGPGGRFARASGAAILVLAPYLMKTLSVAGTAAMFLVGGGIVTHGIGPVHHAIEHAAAAVAAWPGALAALSAVVPTVLNGTVGVLLGALTLGAVQLVRRVSQRRAARATKNDSAR